MSNETYTKGPLRLFEVGDRFKHLCPATADGQSLLTIVEEDGVQFAAIWNEADARLFSVAGELLEALQDLCSFDLLTQDKWDKARAAIAKATGEQA